MVRSHARYKTWKLTQSSVVFPSQPGSAACGLFVACVTWEASKEGMGGCGWTYRGDEGDHSNLLQENLLWGRRQSWLTAQLSPTSTSAPRPCFPGFLPAKGQVQQGARIGPFLPARGHFWWATFARRLAGDQVEDQLKTLKGLAKVLARLSRLAQHVPEV